MGYMLMAEVGIILRTGHSYTYWNKFISSFKLSTHPFWTVYEYALSITYTLHSDANMFENWGCLYFILVCLWMGVFCVWKRHAWTACFAVSGGVDFVCHGSIYFVWIASFFLYCLANIFIWDVLIIYFCALFWLFGGLFSVYLSHLFFCSDYSGIKLAYFVVIFI